LPVIEHQQLARQVGTFDAIVFKSSADFKNNAVRGNLISRGSVLQQPYGLDVTATTAFRLPVTGLHLSRIQLRLAWILARTNTRKQVGEKPGDLSCSKFYQIRS
jgi:hypothetical protein